MSMIPTLCGLLTTRTLVDLLVGCDALDAAELLAEEGGGFVLSTVADWLSDVDVSVAKGGLFDEPKKGVISIKSLSRLRLDCTVAESPLFL